MARRSFAVFHPRVLAVGLILTLSACGLGGGETTSPKSALPGSDDDIYRWGSILSEEGGIDLLGGKRKDQAEGTGIGVNSFLWRASLDTLSFMPITQADPFGGVILTDWYSPPDAPNERFKVNLYILDRQLRADGVRASVFRQRRQGAGWVEAGVDPVTKNALEDAILTRARQIRIAQQQAGN